MEFKRFIVKPNVEMHAGIVVDKNTEATFETENIKQTIKDLVLHTVTNVKGDGYESTYEVTVYLNEGDVLVFEPEGRGYIKPMETMYTIKDAIKELEYIADIE